MQKSKEELALEFANKLNDYKHSYKVPRNCLCPGLYLGFLAGYDKAKEPQRTVFTIEEELENMKCDPEKYATKLGQEAYGRLIQQFEELIKKKVKD